MVLCGHMQANGTAAFTGIEQGRHDAGIFAAGIKQNAAARRHGIDLYFLAGDHLAPSSRP